MRYAALPVLATIMIIAVMASCSKKDDEKPCTETTWYQDADGDGLGNAAVSYTACIQPAGYVEDNTDTDDSLPCTETTWYQDADGDGLGNSDVSLSACSQPTGYVADSTDTDDGGTTSGLHAAFAEFDVNNYNIYLDGNEVVIESNGLPNHTSPYWSNVTARSTTDPRGNTLTTPAAASNHALFVEPMVTSYANMAPGNIDDFNGTYTLRIPVDPQLASSPTATGLGAIGMAVSGSMIYNDEEGPNIPLDDAAPSLDYTAAHTGPQSYHYHLEPKAWSDDDEELIGVIADGFFLYGRKCNSTGTYPTDLDASGGHTSTTQHSSTAEYHYHIQNTTYLNQYYLLFPGDYQGTPNTIQ